MSNFSFFPVGAIIGIGRSFDASRIGEYAAGRAEMSTRPDGSWIRADYRFSNHVANVRIPWSFFQKYFYPEMLQAYHDARTEPECLVKMFRALLSVANGGIYATADIWRLYSPHAHDCWYVSICHPDLPAFEAGCELSVIDLEFEEKDIRDFQQMIPEFM